MKYVFNTEGENEILGEYLGTDEDAVVYRRPGSGHASAPSDCVTVKEITRDEIVEVLDGFKRSLDVVKSWVGGDSLTAMNSLMALQVEMREYAYVMGSRLNDDAAATELRRQVREGHYRSERSHSRQFEEPPFGVREPAEKF